MNFYINNGNGYQPVKVADKIDFEPPKTGSNIKPLPIKELNFTVSCFNKDYEFFKKLSDAAKEQACSLLMAVPRDLQDGDRKIEKCPTCGKKLYIQRNKEEIRLSCSGCKLDIRALYQSICFIQNVQRGREKEND